MPLCFVKYDVDLTVYELDILLTPKPILYDAENGIGTYSGDERFRHVWISG